MKDFGKNGLGVVQDLWFTVRNEHAKAWVKASEEKLTELRNQNADQSLILEAEKERDKAVRIQKFTETTVTEQDPAKREQSRERLLHNLEINFEKDGQNNLKIMDPTYDPDSIHHKEFQHHLLQRHMTAEFNVLNYIGEIFENTPALAQIYDQRFKEESGGVLKNIDEIRKIIDKIPDLDYEKVGSVIASICAGKYEMENLDNKLISDAYKGQLTGARGTGYKTENDTAKYQAPFKEDDGRQA